MHAQEMSLGAAQGSSGEEISISLQLTSSAGVEGLSAVFEWNGAIAEGVSLTPAAAIEGVDLLVSRAEANFMVLGVVVDTDGSGEFVIPSGNNTLLATANVRCLEPGVTDIVFVDNKYASVAGGALLANLVVQDGQGIGVNEGLVVTNGSVECTQASTRFSIDSSVEEEARVLLDSGVPIEGFVVALCHDPSALQLRNIVLGDVVSVLNPEFTSIELDSGGGVVATIFDVEPPFDGQTLAPGTDRHIASYVYDCLDTSSETSDVEFCDLVLSQPAKENVIVSGGKSFSPELEGGVVMCAAQPCDREICNNRIDDDCDGLVDAEDDECQEVAFFCGPADFREGDDPTIRVAPGAAVDVCFFIRNPEDNAVGQEKQFDHLQGFSMSIGFSCDLTARDEFDITDTILEALRAEFVLPQVDNDEDDGDGCELIIGVLIDAVAPFDGATIPPLDFPQRMGCVRFTVDDNPDLCGWCLPIEFIDGLSGSDMVPTKNLVSAENEARSPLLNGCEICVGDAALFFRGDCNFDGGAEGLAVDIGDAGALISHLFFPVGSRFEVPCQDACDCNDDGRLDIADATCMLAYLFQSGPMPDLPGPGAVGVIGDDLPLRATPRGVDPTADDLGCTGGTDCGS